MSNPISSLSPQNAFSKCITSVDPQTSKNEADISHLKAIASAIGDCGFTIVAKKTGLPESKQVCEYVQNHSNDVQVDIDQM